MDCPEILSIDMSSFHTMSRPSKIIAWLLPFLILLVITDLTLRYLFQITSIWIVELEWHIFSAVFLLGGAYTLKKDKHVRVDILYQKLGKRWQYVVDVIGHIVFSLPWLAIVIYTGILYTSRSWQLLESSPDPSGLPFRFLIKGIIPLSFVLIAFQVIMELRKMIKELRQ